MSAMADTAFQSTPPDASVETAGAAKDVMQMLLVRAGLEAGLGETHDAGSVPNQNVDTTTNRRGSGRATTQHRRAVQAGKRWRQDQACMRVSVAVLAAMACRPAMSPSW